ncbi:hypothetical protein [Brachyspira hampsonii]|uniref:hypothetical protein n=1 Tax=Brachyspira hampsonii TaxID=1287055 RepID=UPI000D35E40C|nr:hypothetical protein [Brachyspira hampsonii]PTY39800.1 hypothetical protein DQ06_04110 [Brachyspira hampsonii bv. II]
MIKKLFLFTLLVSSFLVISCNNKDKTGPNNASVGIDTIYAGTYSGNTSIYEDFGIMTETMLTTLTVRADGSALIELNNSGAIITIDITKYFQDDGAGKYICKGYNSNYGFPYILYFNFSDSSVSIQMTQNYSEDSTLIPDIRVGTLNASTAAQ